MVVYHIIDAAAEQQVSVLALSSRFDGRRPLCMSGWPRVCFSTRSVESF